MLPYVKEFERFISNGRAWSTRGSRNQFGSSVCEVAPPSKCFVAPKATYRSHFVQRFYMVRGIFPPRGNFLINLELFYMDNGKCLKNDYITV